jgi:hypothetical protein
VVLATDRSRAGSVSDAVTLAPAEGVVIAL